MNDSLYGLSMYTSLHCTALHYANVHCSILHCSNAEMSLLSVMENSRSWLLRCKKLLNLGFCRSRKIPLRKHLKRQEAREAGF